MNWFYLVYEIKFHEWLELNHDLNEQLNLLLESKMNSFLIRPIICHINTCCLSRIFRETHNCFHWNSSRSNSYKELLRIRMDFFVLHGFVTIKVFNVEKRRGTYSWGTRFPKLLHKSSREKRKLKPFVRRKKMAIIRFIMIKVIFSDN